MIVLPRTRVEFEPASFESVRPIERPEAIYPAAQSLLLGLISLSRFAFFRKARVDDPAVMTILAWRPSTPPLVPLQSSPDRECIFRQAAFGEGGFDTQHAGGEPSCLVRRFVKIEVPASIKETRNAAGAAGVIVRPRRTRSRKAAEYS